MRAKVYSDGSVRTMIKVPAPLWRVVDEICTQLIMPRGVFVTLALLSFAPQWLALMQRKGVNFTASAVLGTVETQVAQVLNDLRKDL